jgi:hypothetical protein
VDRLTSEVAEWLVSEAGLEAVAAASTRLRGGAGALAVASSLRQELGDPDRVSAVLGAAEARLRSVRDREQADLLLFTRESLEQASAAAVSRWRARRFSEQDVWDLCAGCGGDTMALAAVARSVTAVEWDPGRSVLLRHNLEVLGLIATVVTADALQVRPPAHCLVHVDPARRRDGRRVRRLAETVPSVPALVARHGAARGLGIVLSPALDHDDPDHPPDAEVEYLQLGNDLVEAVAWQGALRAEGASATATLLPAGVQRSRRGPRPPRLAVAKLGTHLLEVAPAAVRARLHDDLGGEIGAKRIAARRALLTTEGRPPSSPWYRARPVLAVLPARAKQVRGWLRHEDPGEIEIALHGVSLDPERWWREIGRPPRGPGGIRLELTRLDEGTVVIVTDGSLGDVGPGPSS